MLKPPIQQKINTTVLCYHCGTECREQEIKFEKKSFCCEGCKTVFSLLNENGMCTYYDLEKNPGITIKTKNFENKYDYLENQEVFEKLTDFADNSIAKITFYIPSIHCASCIWLLENLYKLQPGVKNSEVQFLKRQVHISFNPNEISLKKLVEVLSTIGYEPEIRLNDIEKKKSGIIDRSLIFKLGVAGFCFGNIMLFSFPEYFHLNDLVDPGFRSFFGYLNLLLSLPVLLYSGSGYFISAWTGLKHKIINIDFPLSLGILVMFIRSSYEIIILRGGGYMDALAGLVFLLLVGKWFQDKTYYALSFERDYKSYFPISVIRIKGNEKEAVRLDELKTGDIIQIRNGELIPADGILIEGSAEIDYSFVTGESLPVEKNMGEKVYAGGKQTSGIIKISLLKSVSQSYLTQLWNKDIFSKKSGININTRVNTVSKYFTITVISIAIISAVFWSFTDINKAVNAFTAVLIITCPCALALTVPFTFGNALRIYGRNELYLKKSEIIEELSHIDTVVFDKTGTITTPDSGMIVYEGENLTSDEQDVIAHMTLTSTHPLSKAIHKHFLNSINDLRFPVKEISGKGLEANVEGKNYKLGSKKFISGLNHTQTDFKDAEVYISINNIEKGKFRIQNNYREGLEEMVNEMKTNYHLHILSGDNESEKSRLLSLFGERTPMAFHQTPEKKLEYISELQKKGHRILMIGDGLNDAGALKQSDVGIAVSESSGSFFPACDGMLKSVQLKNLPRFLKMSKESMKTTKLSFLISLFYNLIGISFAVRGELLPVIAAILMPVSSVTVIAFTVLRTNWIGKKLSL